MLLRGVHNQQAALRESAGANGIHAVQCVVGPLGHRERQQTTRRRGSNEAVLQQQTQRTSRAVVVRVEHVDEGQRQFAVARTDETSMLVNEETQTHSLCVHGSESFDDVRICSQNRFCVCCNALTTVSFTLGLKIWSASTRPRNHRQFMAH
jgi:hypothetical protein